MIIGRFQGFRAGQRSVEGAMGVRLGLVFALLTAAVVMLGVVVAGCGGGGTTTSAPGGAPSTSAPALKRGGVLKVGQQPAGNLDPHFASTTPDIMLSAQIYDFLVYIDDTNTVVPDVATKWESSSDAKTWTFEIRDDIKFSNGKPLTAADVVFSFNRLRDPKVGSPAASLYENIASVSSPDPTHVRFTLTNPNPEFPSDAGDYHAAILPRDVKNPAQERIGSGPFVLKSYSPEDRAVLVPNPNYWKKGEDGKPLPYLDEVDFIFSPDQAAQVEALRGGELQFVPELSTQLADTVEADPNLRVITNMSNFHWVIRMRSDKGHPASDVRVRQALKLATDHQEIVNAVRPGLAVVGNGTPVGPLYKDYYLDKKPVVDLIRAKQLLTEAGHPNGLTITLVAQNRLDVPAIATVWKNQMAKIGVTVNIQTVPSDVYYAEPGNLWLTTDFGITDWAARATPVAYFKLAYVTNGLFNESHWSDTEFDDLTGQIDKEADKTKRIELYRRAQQILIDRGPVIVPYIEEAAAGISANVTGIKLASDFARTLLRDAHYVK